MGIEVIVKSNQYRSGATSTVNISNPAYAYDGNEDTCATITRPQTTVGGSEGTVAYRHLQLAHSSFWTKPQGLSDEYVVVGAKVIVTYKTTNSEVDSQGSDYNLANETYIRLRDVNGTTKYWEAFLDPSTTKVTRTFNIPLDVIETLAPSRGYFETAYVYSSRYWADSSKNRTFAAQSLYIYEETVIVTYAKESTLVRVTKKPTYTNIRTNQASSVVNPEHAYDGDATGTWAVITATTNTTTTTEVYAAVDYRFSFSDIPENAIVREAVLSAKTLHTYGGGGGGSGAFGAGAALVIRRRASQALWDWTDIVTTYDGFSSSAATVYSEDLLTVPTARRGATYPPISAWEDWISGPQQVVEAYPHLDGTMYSGTYSRLNLYDIYLDLVYEVPETTPVRVKVNGEWQNGYLRAKVRGEWIDANLRLKVNGQWVNLEDES